MKKILAVAVVLLMAASAQASYVDAININFAHTENGVDVGLVSGTNATPQAPSGALAGGWNNCIAQQDPNGGAWQTGWGLTWGATPATAKGEVVSNLGTMIYCNDSSNRPGTTSGAAGLTLRGISGDGSNDYWQVSNIPASFRTLGATYDVFKLTSDGVWTQIANGQTAETFGRNNVDGLNMSAIQILSVPEPATMSLLAAGGIATLIRRRNRR